MPDVGIVPRQVEEHRAADGAAHDVSRAGEGAAAVRRRRGAEESQLEATARGAAHVSEAVENGQEGAERLAGAGAVLGGLEAAETAQGVLADQGKLHGLAAGQGGGREITSKHLSEATGRTVQEKGHGELWDSEGGWVRASWRARDERALPALLLPLGDGHPCARLNLQFFEEGLVH